MVSLQYTITKADYINFYNYVMWEAADRRRSRYKNILQQIGFVAAFIGVYYLAGGFRFFSKFSLIIVLLMFGTAFFPLFTAKSAVNREAEDITSDPENESVFTGNILDVDDTGLEVKTETADIRYTWKAITRKTETADYYFLFLNAMHALIIPKRALEPEPAAEFERLLTKNLPLDAEIKDAMDGRK